MKNVFFSLAVLFAATNMTAQTGWKYSVSKEGKATHKQCVALSVDTDMVVFHVSGATYEVFDLIGKDHNGQDLWESRANGKRVHRMVQDDGTVVFIAKMDDGGQVKKAFYYEP